MRALLLLVSSTLLAQDDAAVSILQENCASCHGSAVMAGLDLRQREGLLKGGARGVALIPGNSQGSLFLQAVRKTGSLQMPPGKKSLTPDQIQTLARWVDREAHMNDSDKIRCYVTNAAFRRVLRRSGYFVVKSGIDLTVKVNAVPVPKGFYDSADAWHFTLGDGELDY